MLTDDTRKKLEIIIGGARIIGATDSCSAIRNYLCEGFRTGPTIKSQFSSKSIDKEEQAIALGSYARKSGIWFDEIPKDWLFLAKGGESEVYLSPDNKSVYKANDAVYYATWLEFFQSLLIHNLLFPDTTYKCIGFSALNISGEQKLVTLLQQPYVQISQNASLTDIRSYLSNNGFNHIKRQDYQLAELGLLLEDMHDENVLVKDDLLFFIDTVFYIL
jgi:hypothetical protein